MRVARCFRDTEYDEIVTVEQLLKEYLEQKRYLDVSFDEYLRNCCDKNGSLEEVKEYGYTDFYRLNPEL